jgi:Family of unknown function (DUF6076)
VCEIIILRVIYNSVFLKYIFLKGDDLFMNLDNNKYPESVSMSIDETNNSITVGSCSLSFHNAESEYRFGNSTPLHKKAIGSLLLRFLNANFNSIEGFTDFFCGEKGFGIVGLYDFISPKNKIKAYGSSLSNDEYLVAMKSLWDETKDILISTQEQYTKVLDICTNRANLDYLENLSVLNRFWCALQTNTLEDYSDNLHVKRFLDFKGKDFSNFSEYLDVSFSNPEDFSSKIGERSAIFYTDFYSQDIRSLIYIDFVNHLKDSQIKICKNCGSYFVPTGRIDTEYCNSKAPNSKKTCSEIGALSVYREGIKDNPYMQIFESTYKKISSRKRLKKISEKDFTEWSINARKLRDAAKTQAMDIEEYKIALKNLE